MPHNEEIDRRIIRITSAWKNTERKKMFGGACHLLNGNMFCGVYKNYLILRLGEQNAHRAAANPTVKPLDITGKPMKGWVMVEENGFREDRQLRAWLQSAKTFAATLPPKPANKKAKNR